MKESDYSERCDAHFSQYPLHAILDLYSDVTECRFWVVNYHWLIEFEWLFSPKPTLKPQSPETIFGHKPTHGKCRWLNILSPEPASVWCYIGWFQSTNSRVNWIRWMGKITALIFDLDGTIYRGSDAVPGACEFIASLQRRKIPFLFVTLWKNCFLASRFSTLINY
jgi:hypothetical protein